MIPASTNGGGSCAVPGPLDSCKTPSPGGPVPLPYPNLGQVSGAKGSSVAKKVKFDGKKVVLKKTELSRSSGDEPGTVGGIISNKNMGPICFKKGSGKVKVEAEDAVYLGCMTGQNGSNANVPAGAQVAPSQTKVLLGP